MWLIYCENVVFCVFQNIYTYFFYIYIKKNYKFSISLTHDVQAKIIQYAMWLSSYNLFYNKLQTIFKSVMK